jgi:anti-sigma factor RsiW
MWQAFRRSKKNECSRTRDVLSGYVDRRLSPEEAARVEDHLSTCQGCWEELESLRATVALLRRLPEVTPSRSFALAPVKPLPGRRVMPALRLATAGAVLLLVVAFTVDWTGAFEQSGPSDVYYEPAAAYESDADYWLVPGVRNDIADSDNVTETAVSLVVPDASDNVCAAVDSLVGGGVVYGTIGPSPEGMLQLVLTESEEGTSTQGNVKEFAVVSTADKNTSPFAPSGPEVTSALDDIVNSQEGEFLNVVPANSDNTVLYAFDLGDSVPAEIRLVPSGDSGTGGSYAVLGSSDEDQWLRPVEYALIGLVAVLGVATAALWLTQRRARVREVSDNKD